MQYEYKVLPAPEKGEKTRGLRGADWRFAAAVERAMNDMGAQGWEYLRSDTLPSTERSGLQTTTVWRNLLVFRRPLAEEAGIETPKLLEPPQRALVLGDAFREAPGPVTAPVSNGRDRTGDADGLRERAVRLAQAHRPPR